MDFQQRQGDLQPVRGAGLSAIPTTDCRGQHARWIILFIATYVNDGLIIDYRPVVRQSHFAPEVKYLEHLRKVNSSHSDVKLVSRTRAVRSSSEGGVKNHSSLHPSALMRVRLKPKSSRKLKARCPASSPSSCRHGRHRLHAFRRELRRLHQVSYFSYHSFLQRHPTLILPAR